jgi:deoxyadenosine/deoxycytidine kinase
MIYRNCWYRKSLDEFIAKANYIQSESIGIEGTVFSGKTTYAKKLESKGKYFLVKEHTDISLEAKKIAISDWSEKDSDILLRQNYFIKVECIRFKKRPSIKNKKIIFDRTIFSVIGYLIVRLKNHPNRLKILKKVLRNCLLKMIKGEMRIPETLVYLKINYATFRERACYRDAWKKRGTEPFLLKRDVYLRYIAFYRELISIIEKYKFIQVITINE